MAYPVDVQVDYGDGTRSRALAVAGILFPIKLLIVLPHLIILYVLNIGATFAAWFGFFGIVFTGRLSPGFARFIHNYFGWNLRLAAYITGLRDEYPAFSLEQSEYAARVIITEPTLERSRGLALTGILFFLKGILLIPHVFVIYLLGYAAMVIGWIAYWIVALTGTYPQGIYKFIVGMLRWYTRMTAWLFSITDVYPPFSLNE